MTELVMPNTEEMVGILASAPDHASCERDDLEPVTGKRPRVSTDNKAAATAACPDPGNGSRSMGPDLASQGTAHVSHRRPADLQIHSSTDIRLLNDPTLQRSVAALSQ